MLLLLLFIELLFAGFEVKPKELLLIELVEELIPKGNANEELLPELLRFNKVLVTLVVEEDRVGGGSSEKEDKNGDVFEKADDKLRGLKDGVVLVECNDDKEEEDIGKD